MHYPRVLVIVLFYALCSIFAFYVTFDQFKKYLKNEDSTSIKIQNFRTAEENPYPDISLCFTANSSTFFNESSLPYNISSQDMLRIMQGKTDMLEKETIHYGSRILKTLSKAGQNAYEELLTASLNDIIDKWWVVSSKHFVDNDSELEDANQPNDNYVSITWLQPHTGCLTLKLKYVPHEVLERQNLFLRLQNLQSFSHMWFFIHPPNQLIRRVGWNKLNTATARVKIQSKYDRASNLVEIFLVSLKTIKRRNKSGENCNEDLQDDDNQWIQQLYSNLGCIPVYWNKKLDGWKTEFIPKICETIAEYNKAFNFTQNYWNITMQYDPPCKHLISQAYATIRSSLLAGVLQRRVDELNSKRQIFLRIRYKVSDYEEVTNERLFNEWDLFSQVGGTIGLLLGFSFLQLPDALHNLAMKMKERYKKTTDDNVSNDVVEVQSTTRLGTKDSTAE